MALMRDNGAASFLVKRLEPRRNDCLTYGEFCVRLCERAFVRLGKITLDKEPTACVWRIMMAVNLRRRVLAAPTLAA